MARKEPAREELVRRRTRQILEAAARVFARKGFHKATMKEIAREAGIAPGTIYLYFKNKKDLLVNLPRLVSEAFIEELQSLEARPLSEAELRSLVRNQLDLALENVEIFRVLFSSLPLMDEQTKEEYLRRSPLRLVAVIEGFIRRGIERGAFRPVDSTIAAWAFLGMVFVFFLGQEVMPGRAIARFDYDQVVEQVVSIFMRGILKPQSQEV